MLRDFLPVFRKSNNDIIRFEAITDKDLNHPQRVAKSHIGALQLALEGGFKNVLILEDDVLWRVSPNRSNLFLLVDLVTKPFDVIMFGGTAVERRSDFSILYAQATSSYLVKGAYIQSVINCFSEALDLLLHDPKNIPLFAIDVWWNKLMKIDRWFIVTPALVIQKTYPIDFGYKKNDGYTSKKLPILQHSSVKIEVTV